MQSFCEIYFDELKQISVMKKIFQVKPQDNAEITLVSISRLRVNIQDVNNRAPKFLGTDSNGVYTAAVTPYTKAGEFVVVVTAVDLDKSWPNNKVG